MISIRVGEQERDVRAIEYAWISEHIERRRADGSDPCVVLIVQEGDTNLVFTCGECPVFKRQLESPRPEEEGLFEMWAEHGLKLPFYPTSELIKAIEYIVGKF